MLAPQRAATAVTVAAALSVGLSSCSIATTPQLADRSDPTVRAEEDRVRGLVERSDPWHDGASWHCRVRLLRQQESTAWAWSFCESTTSPGKFVNPVRVDGDPVRVDGDAVRWPGDQPTWNADIRREFPADLVNLAETGNNRFLADLGLPVT